MNLSTKGQVLHPLFVFFILSIFSVTLSGCTIEAQPIDFGNDQCHFCRMTVVDRLHASQTVTKKGKQFSYDAIECLVKEILKEDFEDGFAIMLVADYNEGKMVPATEATYLISEEIQSPMGENLSAFETKESAEAAQKEHGGELYSWESLKTQLSKEKK